MTEERMQTYERVTAEIQAGSTVAEATKRAGKNPSWYYSTSSELRKARKKKRSKVTAKGMPRKKYKRTPAPQMVDLPQVTAPLLTQARLLVFTGSPAELLTIVRSLS